MDIILKPKQITICLAVAHIAGQCITFTLGSEGVFKPLVRLVDFNEERNIPTFYSSLSLLFCSFLLVIITFAKRKNGEQYIFWLGLAVIFMFLSIDEFVMIHESFGSKLRNVLNTSGFLFFAWVIPYGIFIIMFLLLYAKFLLNLPSKSRVLFIIAGSIYVLSAIGFELIEGKYSAYSDSNVTYMTFITIEELLEMTGIAVFIYALSSYIDTELKDLRLRIKS